MMKRRMQEAWSRPQWARDMKGGKKRTEKEKEKQKGKGCDVLMFQHTAQQVFHHKLKTRQVW